VRDNNAVTTTGTVAIAFGMNGKTGRYEFAGRIEGGIVYKRG